MKGFEAFQKTVQHYSSTQVIDRFVGDETISYAAAVNIVGPFFKRNEEFNQKIEGLFRGSDAIFLAETTTTIKRNDKIAYDSEEYIVLDVVTRRIQNVDFYKAVRLKRL